MNPPVEGMKLRPWGDPVMAPAFLSAAVAWAARPGVLAAFLDARRDIAALLPAETRRSALDVLMDGATGAEDARGRRITAAWLDWFAKFVWGVEGTGTRAKARRI